MAVRFVPNLDYIFELDTAQQQPEIDDAVIRLLQGWGRACRGEFRHLQYARVQLEEATPSEVVGSILSEDELTLLDHALSKLKTEQPEYFELLHLRYMRSRKISQICSELERSSKVVRKRLGLLNSVVYNLVAVEYGGKKRLSLSARVFGSKFVSSLQS